MPAFPDLPAPDAGVLAAGLGHLPEDRSRVFQLLSRVHFLEGLPAGVVGALAQVARAARYDPGEVIFLEGDAAHAIYLLEQGVVKISRTSLEGREYIMHLVQAGGTFNDVAALDGGPSPATATALTLATLWRIERADLQRITAEHPALAWALMADLAGRARYLVGVVEDLAMRSVRGRLARLLLEQAMASRTEVVPMMMTQEEMAARLGTVREMVGRTLRSMAAAGILEFDRHRIVVLDPESLAQEAEV
jgi:CRP/FNR family transcriptional regulator